MTHSSELLERQAERDRARLASTLDELRTRATPGQVADQLMDYARDGAVGDFVRNLGRQVRHNPLPVTLVGAGIAWLMVSSARNGSAASGNGLAKASTANRWSEGNASWAGDGHDSGWTDGMKERASSMGTAASDAASRMGDSMSAAGESLRGAGESAASAVSEGLSEGYRRTRDFASNAVGTAGDSASAMSHHAASMSRSFVDLCRDQPLVLGGIGLAIGAALGAFLPRTEAEDRLMGETSDAMKRQAAETASEHADKVERMAEDAFAEVKTQPAQDAAEHGHEPGKESERPAPETVTTLGNMRTEPLRGNGLAGDRH